MHETYRFPGAFVFRCRNPHHDALKAELLPKIIKKAEEVKDDPQWEWYEDSRSSMRTSYILETQNPWNIFSVENIQQIALDSTTQLLESGQNFGSVPDTFSVKGIWWNRYPAGSSAPPHTHSGALSGVYILEQNEPCPLSFYHSNPFGLNHDGGVGEEFRSNAEEGDVLLFPPTLLHWVRPTLDWRTTISFNLGWETS
jgi:hypothetical protein